MLNFPSNFSIYFNSILNLKESLFLDTRANHSNPFSIFIIYLQKSFLLLHLQSIRHHFISPCQIFKKEHLEQNHHQLS